eukprot:TRINITY_DN6593_c0_g2_i2.p1 TRINITY_DN6593_c0_g2~~TRINITY_DN6593_c0_g2_i2.p1  ORF type:complete len:540 (-),score=119.21 TRINITY_DN6593_c0_g2_i2:1142-2584(-)
MAAPNRSAESSDISPLQKVLSCFILSVLCDNNPPGQSDILQSGGLGIFQHQLKSSCALVRRWAILAIAKLWTKHEDAQWVALKDNIPEVLKEYLVDPVPEVRAATVYAFSCFIGGGGSPHPRNEAYSLKRQLTDIALGKDMSELCKDASPLVRIELILTLGNLVVSQRELFHQTAMIMEKDIPAEGPSSNLFELSKDVLLAILMLRCDPFPQVAEIANEIACIVFPNLKVSFSQSPQAGSNSAPGAPGPLQRERNAQELASKLRAANVNVKRISSMQDMSSASMKLQAERRMRHEEEHKRAVAAAGANAGAAELSSFLLRRSDFYEWSAEFVNHPLLYNEEGAGEAWNDFGSTILSPVGDSVASQLSRFHAEEEFCDSLGSYYHKGTDFELVTRERFLQERNATALSEANTVLQYYDDKRRFDDEIAILNTDSSFGMTLDPQFFLLWVTALPVNCQGSMPKRSFVTLLEVTITREQTLSW